MQDLGQPVAFQKIKNYMRQYHDVEFSKPQFDMALMNSNEKKKISNINFLLNKMLNLILLNEIFHYLNCIFANQIMHTSHCGSINFEYMHSEPLSHVLSVTDYNKTIMDVTIQRCVHDDSEPVEVALDDRRKSRANDIFLLFFWQIPKNRSEFNRDE